ncbi:MAG: hypothetical protein ACP5FH_06935 [Terracidiphilus sp.]
MLEQTSLGREGENFLCCAMRAWRQRRESWDGLASFIVSHRPVETAGSNKKQAADGPWTRFHRRLLLVLVAMTT